MPEPSSQYGQAEEILSLFENLGYASGTIFEAGAHSPHRLSNSRPFLKKGWTAYLSECDKAFVMEWNESGLQNFILDDSGIPNHSSGLNDVLRRLLVPNSLNVLFLDIDGGEYELIRNLEFRPDVICVEYENSLPMLVSFAPSSVRTHAQASSWSFFTMMQGKKYFFAKSYFGDLLFFSQEFVLSHRLHSKMPLGYEAYLKYAPTAGYNLYPVLMNQCHGGDGVKFYEHKLDVFIREGGIAVAERQFAYLCQAIHSFLPVAMLRGAEYQHQLTESFQKFVDKFSIELSKRNDR